MFGVEDETGFIELDRTFHELSAEPGKSDDADLQRSFFRRDPLTWTELTEEFRAIILSEAGTGKTQELRHTARFLRAQGKAAFFIRLEFVPDHFQDAFEVGTLEEFRTWVASTAEGWLFCDSVDEARLRHPRDFEVAICKLGGQIAAAQQRAHILITGRTTAWRPKSDLEHCERHLPFRHPSTTVSAEADEFDPDTDDDTVNTNDSRGNQEQPMFRIVALTDLDSKQIKAFASAKNAVDLDGFLDAIERADASSFASRPQDLQELVEFWKSRKSIGSRLEIMESSIARRLAEREQDRSELRPLVPLRARDGARRIAAALTLTHESSIRVPDGSENSRGVSVVDILPDWNDTDQTTLLLRPVFDEAIYGTVRFHHRSVREFLTAECFAELLKRDTSRRNIESLLFRDQYGMHVVPPAMRPVLPWLAILDHRVCERLQRVAPEVLLEGGDPSRLPLQTRRAILRQVCEQIATGAIRWTTTDYSAVQRFASPDIVDDVKDLIGKHAANDELASFLLRMIWQGRLKEALPEAKAIALDAGASKYTRIFAFRAVVAVGTPDDMQQVRVRFLNESAEINRDWLAELLHDLPSTAASVQWLSDCLAKCAPKKPHSVDHLTDNVVDFVNAATIDLLPQIAIDFNRLLSVPPIIERRYCEISQEYAWLIRPAAHAAKRLIEARHPASLQTDVVAILHKVRTASDRDTGDYSQTKFGFAELVPAWPELNRASFWYEVERACVSPADSPTEHWQLSVFGSYWRFDPSEFDYVLTQIHHRVLPAERQLALSLAFYLYVQGGRVRRQRDLLKRAVAEDAALSKSLADYLKPPRRGGNSWKRSEAQWKRRTEAHERKQRRNREKSRDHLRSNVATLRNCRLPRGKISNDQWYLHQRMVREDDRSGRWTDGNWRDLIEEFGEDVAQAFRDGTVGFWRTYTPKLRSEGAPANETPTAVIFGLTGLHIEAAETANWPATLNTADVAHACRYASCELNGFPVWFPALFDAHPSVVGDFLLSEIRSELATETPDGQSHYILSDVVSTGQWAWNQLAPAVYDTLAAKEPANLSNLNDLLTIVQDGSVADLELARLAAKKGKARISMDHKALWFAVWVGVDPSAAIPALAVHVDKIAKPKTRTDFAMRFIINLLGGRRGVRSGVRTAFHAPDHLKSLYLLMHRHISTTDDIHRAGGGAYSPGLRDDAQDTRDGLAELIRNIPGKEAFVALSDIALAHPEESYRPRFALLAKTKAESDADIPAWSPQQVHDFISSLECSPTTHRELAELVRLRLLDLKDDLEHGDSSIAGILKDVSQETDIRKYMGGVLRDKAAGRYSIPQEEELADAKRPDFRVHGAGFDGPVPIELKLADNWTGAQLLERLENQLCGDYLRDNRSSRGFFVLFHQGKKKKKWSISMRHVAFDGLVDALNAHWVNIAVRFANVEEIAVIGIDLTKR